MTSSSLSSLPKGERMTSTISNKHLFKFRILTGIVFAIISQKQFELAKNNLLTMKDEKMHPVHCK
jgi:hypothetical protein